jgi:hypothetical protein
MAQEPHPDDAKLNLDGRRENAPVRIGQGKLILPQLGVGAGNAVGPIGGIGVVLQTHNGFGVVIRAVLPNSPAAKAGLEAGQVITEVDGRRLEDVSIPTAQSLLNGPLGSAVRIEMIDPPDANRTRVVHLSRTAKPGQLMLLRPRPPANAFKEAFKGQLFPPVPGRFDPKLESVARYSPADDGAEEAIRAALSGEGVTFSLTEEGGVPTIRTQASDRALANRIVEKLRENGHWSMTPLPMKETKAAATIR